MKIKSKTILISKYLIYDVLDIVKEAIIKEGHKYENSNVKNDKITIQVVFDIPGIKIPLEIRIEKVTNNTGVIIAEVKDSTIRQLYNTILNSIGKANRDKLHHRYNTDNDVIIATNILADAYRKIRFLIDEIEILFEIKLQDYTPYVIYSNTDITNIIHREFNKYGFNKKDDAYIDKVYKVKIITKRIDDKFKYEIYPTYIYNNKEYRSVEDILTSDLDRDTDTILLLYNSVVEHIMKIIEMTIKKYDKKV